VSAGPRPGVLEVRPQVLQARVGGSDVIRPALGVHYDMEAKPAYPGAGHSSRFAPSTFISARSRFDLLRDVQTKMKQQGCNIAVSLCRDAIGSIDGV